MKKWNPFWLFGTEVGRANLLAFFSYFVECSSEHRPGRLSAWWMYVYLAVVATSAAEIVSSFYSLFTPSQLLLAFVLSCMTSLCFFLWLFYLDYQPSIVMVMSVKKQRRKATRTA